MSAKALAELLDELVARREASLAESSTQAIVSGLRKEGALQVCALSRELGWDAKAFDNENNSWSEDTLDESFAPFRIVVDKPASPDGVDRVLTDTAFAQWLDDETMSPGWHVARLSAPILTWSAVFSPWEDALQPAALRETKSPRSLVREYGAKRQVPSDICPWLLLDASAVNREDSAFSVWADRSTVALLLSSTNEIDSEDSTLKYKGPPRLSLSALEATEGAYDRLGRKGFSALQELIAWVFEIERETEMRHLLAAAEIAQSGDSETDPIRCIAKFARSALDGARIAYQLSLADISKDTLKLLSDLRKAVAEEIGKLTDQTRQLVATVTGALAVGIGLIAAKLTTSAPPMLLVIVMLVVAGHIALTIWSGWRFIQLQSDLRTDWRPRLYRFLPADDYQRMVTEPVGKAESAFWKGALFSGAITAILCGVVVVVSLSTKTADPDDRHQSAKTPSSPAAIGGSPDQTSGQILRGQTTKPQALKPKLNADPGAKSGQEGPPKDERPVLKRNDNKPADRQ